MTSSLISKSCAITHRTLRCTPNASKKSHSWRTWSRGGVQAHNVRTATKWGGLRNRYKGADRNQAHRETRRFQRIDSWNEGEQKALHLLSSNIGRGAVGGNVNRSNGRINQVSAYWTIRMTTTNPHLSLDERPLEWAAHKEDMISLWNERNNKMLPTQKGEYKGRVLPGHSCLGHTWNWAVVLEENFVGLKYLRCYWDN